MTRRAAWGPLPSDTTLLSVCQFCQPLVLGIVSGPVTFVPFISR